MSSVSEGYGNESGSVVCPLCGALSHAVERGRGGYVEDAVYDIQSCVACDTMFAFPLRTDAFMYEHVYRNIERVPGYERYVYYRDRVRREADPLGYLAQQEAPYWAVRTALQEYQSPEAISVLEYGAGFGYLTYALRKAGFRAMGMDVSARAMREASMAFGDCYVVAEDLRAFAEDNRCRFDAIIATELLEHMSDPHELIERAKRMLKTGGRLIVTTPNRSFFPRCHWQTENPPMHLWWFSETSLRTLGATHGMRVSIVDFEAYNQMKLIWRHSALRQRRAVPATFDRHGRLLASTSRVRSSVVDVVRRSGIKSTRDALKAWIGELARFAYKFPSETYTLAASFQKS